MDPLTIAFIVITVAAAGFSAASTLSTAKRQAEESLTASAIASHNATLQEYNAQVARDRAEKAQRDERRRFAALQGQTEAQIGALGVGPGGSATDLLENVVSEGLESVFRIGKEGEREVFAFQSAAASQRAQAGAFKRQAKAFRRAGFLSAGGTLLGAIGSVVGTKLSARGGTTTPQPEPEPPPPPPPPSRSSSPSSSGSGVLYEPIPRLSESFGRSSSL